MTNGKMSKTRVAWAAFLVGSLTSLSGVNSARAQTAEAGSTIPQLEIRGSIADSQQRANRQIANDEPIVLGSEQFQTSVREQTPDEADSNFANDDQFDLNTDEGRRGQLTRNPVGQDQQQANRIRRARAQAAGPVGVDPDAPTSSTRSSVAADPVQSGNTVTEEEDPFAPTGLRLGTFDVQLSLEQAMGYSSNVSENVDGAAGGFSQTDIEASFTSDWSRHQLQTNLSGSYRLPFDSEEVGEPLFSADTELRLDLVDGYTLTADGFYIAETQEFTDTTLAPGAVDTPLEQTYGGSLELERSDRKFVYALRGSVARETFEDADLGGGITQLQEDQNNDIYSLGLRAGYEVSPAFTPFVEGIYSIRDFDLEVDRNGNQRDGDILELRGGAEIDLGEKLQGEISFGYITEQFDDPLIDDLTGFTVNGELNWSPERDTLVTLTFETETNNSIALNDNGSLTYNTRLDYQRQITDRLSVDAFASVEVETNDESNTTIEIGVGSQYWVNRFMALTADIEYENFSSDAPDSGFDEISGRVGVRLQR
ncbi:MAG: outer membrane beta-barrel protein [Pseudomonadota bacterium]